MDDLAGHNIPQGPDWRRLAILFSWYLAGIPTAYVMHNSCTMGAPGIWARAIRVFIEGVVAFGLGGFIYVGHLSFWDCALGANLKTFLCSFFQGLGRCLFPIRSRTVLLPFPPEKVSTCQCAPKSGHAVESV